MAISAEYANEVGQLLAETCPHVSDSPEAVEKIRAKIVDFHSKLDYPPPIDRVLDWAKDDEAALKDAAEANAVTEAAHQKRRELESMGSEEAKRIAIEEFRAAHPTTERAPITANTNYTEAEMAAMSSDVYAIKVLGQPAPTKNLSQPLAKNEKNWQIEHRKKQIMRQPLTKDSRLNQTLRRMVLEGEIK